MATAEYRGTGITCGGWSQSAAEDRDAPDENDMTADRDHDVRLEGRDGEAEGFGLHAGDRVPNLSVTRVSRPAKTHGLPSNLTANPLTAGRGLNRGRRGR